MDKESSAVRKYLAQRADLIGAIRLPNNAFKKNAGTEVTSDIIFLQKRDRIIDIEPDWVHLDTDENGIKTTAEAAKYVVEGEVLAQDKEKKIIVYKYKAKKNERKKQGHRQPYTKVKITAVSERA